MTRGTLATDRDYDGDDFISYMTGEKKVCRMSIYSGEQTTFGQLGMVKKHFLLKEPVNH